MPKAFCVLETCALPLSELCALCERKTPQRVTCVSSHRVGTFSFSQIYTEEQNTQAFTETLSQPISQSITANVSWKASVTSVCRRPSVGSKRWWESSVRSVSSVRERKVLRERKKLPNVLHASHLIERVFSISHRKTQMNRTPKLSQRHSVNR